MEEGSLLEIQITAQARADLLSIWHYSAERFGEPVATEYVELIIENINLLAGNPSLGRGVEEFPEVKRFLVKKKPSSYGHHLFYRVSGQILQVILLVHSAQEWTNVLKAKIE